MDKLTSDFVAVKVVESMEKHAIAESAAMKSKYAPEIDQLRASQSEPPQATEKAPVAVKDQAGNTEAPDESDNETESLRGRIKALELQVKELIEENNNLKSRSELH